MRVLWKVLRKLSCRLFVSAVRSCVPNAFSSAPCRHQEPAINVLADYNGIPQAAPTRRVYTRTVSIVQATKTSREQLGLLSGQETLL